MGKIIVITSGKGGVGKTTTTINLGAAMNFFKKDVLIVDGNLSTPNIGVCLNSPEVPVNLNHVLSDKADLYESVYEHESGMKVIPSSLSIKELGKINPNKINKFKKDFKKISDYVIIDSAAGLGDEAKELIKLADELLIITNPEMPAITDALKTIKVAEEYKKPVLGIIVTRVKKDKIEMDPETVKDMLETEVIGSIPEDLDVKKALNLKDAVVHTHPKSKAARAYKEIAAKILNENYDSNKDRERIFSKILKGLGLKK